MKLKTKLAHTAQLEFNGREFLRRDIPKEKNEYAEGYLAGFEAARKMAIECVFESHEPQVNISFMGEEEV